MAFRSYSRRDVFKIGVAATGALLVPGRASALSGVKATQVTCYGTLLFDVHEDKQWLPVFKGPISATSSYALKTTTQSLKAETQASVTACYKACQWMTGGTPAEIAKVIARYEDTMGLSKESIVKSLECS